MNHIIIGASAINGSNKSNTDSRKQMICKSQELINNELRSASFYSSNFYTVIIYNMYVVGTVSGMV
jgi:hypothetical protein